MSSLSSSGARIRAVVASADAARRARDAWAWARTAVPFAALVGAAGCLIARTAGASLPWAVVALAAPMLILLALLATVFRGRPISDALAARADDDAGLRGELRSAHWFAGRDPADAWTTWHMERAAETADGINWSVVYSKPRLSVSLAVSVGVLIAAMTLPLRRSSALSAHVPSAIEALSLGEFDLTSAPPDLQRLVLDAAAAVRAGRVSPGDALKGLEPSRAWKALDPSTRQRVEDALRRIALADQNATGKSAPNPAGATVDQADWAREELAARLASEAAQKTANPKDAPTSERQSKEQAGATEESSDGQGGEGSVFKSNQVQREVPDGKGDPSGAMIDPSGPASGEAGTGFGGKHGDPNYRRIQQAAIQAAFKHELVEAAANVGSNDHVNDTRRQTEQSTSALDYARAAAPPTYDRAHVETTAAVPEARLPWLERYFSRTEPR